MQIAGGGDWQRYLDFMNAQLRELLTNYGPIGGIWFDGYWDNRKADWQLEKRYSMIHQLQPAALIGSNHHERPHPGEDFQMFEKDLPGQHTQDWNATTDPQPGLGGRRLFWPRGRLLGGSSSINAMIYIRGAAADYDEWAELTGEPAWSYEHVLPLFRRMEDNSRGADAFHGTGGPLRVEDLRSPHPWSRAVVASAVAAG